MELHLLPFGRAAWDKRKEIMSGLIAARPGPPYDYRDVLWLVPNERTVLTLRALFLEVLRETTGSRGCMPPSIRAFNRFVDAGAARGAGMPVVDDTARLLAIEEAAREAVTRRGRLEVSPDTLAPSLAPLVAAALDTAYAYGLTGDALRRIAPDSLPASLLIDIRRSYESWLGSEGLMDPAAARAAYDPGTDEFAGIGCAVLDGFYDADPAELRVMKALSGVPDFKFVLEAPGLGIPEMRAEGMPYFAADALLGSLGLAAPDGARTRADEEAYALSGALFGGRLISRSKSDAERLGQLTGGVAIVGAINAAEEAQYVAHTIKNGSLDGSIPDLNRVAVWLPEPDAYLPAVERALDDAGIRFCSGIGRPLSQSPVAAALMRLLGVPRDGYTFTGIRAALASPLLVLSPDGNRADAFARFGRAERVTRGRQAWLERLREPREASADAAAVRPALERLIELAGTLPSGRERLSVWCAAARELVSASGMERAVAELGDGVPGLREALEGLLSALVSLEASAARLRSRTTLSGFMYVLKKTLGSRRYSTDERRLSGVRLLTGLELLSGPFDLLFAVGLSEGSVPGQFAPDIFFQGQAAAAGVPGREAHDTREARRFLAALMCAGAVRLVHPETGRRGPIPPSPYLRALMPFVDAGAVIKRDKWCRPSDPALAVSPAGAMRGLAMRAALPGGAGGDALAHALDALPQDTPGLVRVKAALAPRMPGPAPSSPARREFSVTELEEYLLCHYRYYQNRVTGLAPVEDPEDDIAPHRAGSVIHRILADFYRGSSGPVTPRNAGAELDRLRAIAASRFRALPDTAANWELARRFADFLAPRFIESEARLAGSPYMPCGFEQTVRLEVSDEQHGSFVITGKVDRVELSEDGGFAVVDYKTGSYPGSGRPLTELFQLPVYAYMLSRGGADIGGRAVPDRPVGFVYYNLKDGSMRDVVLYEEDTAVPGSESRPRRKATAESLDGRVGEAFGKAVEAVRGILSGRFEPTCSDNTVCERCVYIEVCEKGSGMDGDDGRNNPEGGGHGED